ncbi:MAG: ATP-binding cassette domain-containing protein [Planctomycetota bacterium]
MRKFSISKRFENNVPISPASPNGYAVASERVSAVCRMFGVGLDRLDEHRRTHKCDIEVEDGDIVYITGPSGAGKSVLLRELQSCVPADERINIGEIELPADVAAVDCIDGCSTTIEALQLLGYAGLSDVFCILTSPANLSEGQQYRFRLACALAAGKKAIFADEFCGSLDRITAAVIAYNVRRFAKRNKMTFFLASSHEDILADLQPDVLVVKHFTGPAEVVYKAVACRS